MYLPHPIDLKAGPTPKLSVDLAIATEMFEILYFQFVLRAFIEKCCGFCSL